MNQIMKPIPHIPMPRNSAMCGAACLNMLNSYYGRFDSQKTIWAKICAWDSNGQRNNCRTWKMVQYAQEKGLYAAAVSSQDPISLIEICLLNDIELIALYRPRDNTPYAHFSVIVGMDDENIYLNDPELSSCKGTGVAVQKESFIKRMTSLPGSEISTSSTFVLVSNAKPDLVSCTGRRKDTKDIETFSFPVCLITQPLWVLSIPADRWLDSISRI